MTFQKSTLLLVGLFSIGMLSCNSDNGMESTLIDNSTSTSNTAVTPSAVSSTVSTPSSGTVAHPPTKLGALMNLSAPIGLGAAATGLNPAHGQPGHNCDLDVGAPLGGSVAVPSTTPVNAPAGLTASNTAIATSPNLQPNLKINPAHGKPGHDCAVAVGAPLGGAKASTAASPSPATGLSGLTAPNPTTTSNANLKVNPAHGKPGHDCAVAVGAPLPAK